MADLLVHSQFYSPALLTWQGIYTTPPLAQTVITSILAANNDPDNDAKIWILLAKSGDAYPQTMQIVVPGIRVNRASMAYLSDQYTLQAGTQVCVMTDNANISWQIMGLEVT